MKYVVQWEHEDFSFDIVAGEPRTQFDLGDIEIGPIVPRFRSPELLHSDCLRFVDHEADTVFNYRQVNTIDKEIEILFSLDLTEKEREDCLNFQEIVNLFPKQHRDLRYLRIYPNPYSETVE